MKTGVNFKCFPYNTKTVIVYCVYNCTGMCIEYSRARYCALEQNSTVKSYFYALLLIITAVLLTSLKTEMSRCPTLHPRRPASHHTQLTVQCALCLFLVVFVYHISLFELEASTNRSLRETSSNKCHSPACLFE